MDSYRPDRSRRRCVIRWCRRLKARLTLPAPIVPSARFAVPTKCAATAAMEISVMLVVKMAFWAVCFLVIALGDSALGVFGDVDLRCYQSQMIDVATRANLAPMVNEESGRNRAEFLLPAKPMNADDDAIYAYQSVTIGLHPIPENVARSSKAVARNLVANNWRRTVFLTSSTMVFSHDVNLRNRFALG